MWTEIREEERKGASGESKWAKGMNDGREQRKGMYLRIEGRWRFYNREPKESSVTERSEGLRPEERSGVSFTKAV